MKTVGIIDLGSNSMRISVVCFYNGTYNTIFMDKRTVKLSENMNTDMYLKSCAIERTINAFSEYNEIFTKFGVTQVVAVATAAVRKAKNGDEFIKKVKLNTDIDIEIIDGKREAELDFLAVKDSIDVADGIIIDIGGGSTEIIGMRAGKLENFISVPYASRNITEIFLCPENKQAINNAEKEIFEIFNNITWLKDFENVPIIGLGGCLRAIGKADSVLNNTTYNSGYKMDLKYIDDFYGNIKKMTLDKRIEIFGESKGDIILGGFMPFMSLIRIIKPQYMYVTDKGVKDGIIYSILNNLI